VGATTTDGLTPLHICSTQKHVECARILITAGAPIDAVDFTNNQTALHEATQKECEELVALLLDAEADANIATLRSITPLSSAATRGNLPIAKLLIERGKADLRICGVDGATPLVQACQNGDPDLVAYLIASGGDVNQGNLRLFSPLQLAILSRQRKVIKILVESGAHLESRNCYDMNALFMAAYTRNAEAVKLLIKAGATVDSCRADGATPLHMAVQTAGTSQNDPNALECLQHLLSVGADPNAIFQNSDGPLHIACRTQNEEVARILIAAGADLHAIGSGGKRPVELLKSHETALSFLRLDAEKPAEVGILIYACRRSYQDLLIKYIQAKPEEIMDEEKALALLTECLECKCYDVMSHLIEVSADIRTIQKSCTTSFIESIDDIELRERCQNIVDSRDQYPVHAALRQRRPESEILRLIEVNVDSLNRVDYFCMTAFMIAKSTEASAAILTEILYHVSAISIGGNMQNALVLHYWDSYTNFRLNIPLYNTKAYYEIYLGQPSRIWVGYATADWMPSKDLTAALGDDDRSIGIDSSYQQVHFGNKNFHDHVHSWKVGTVMGVGVDASTGEVSYYYEGEKMGLRKEPYIVSKFKSSPVVPAATLAQGIHCVFNFGEAPMLHMPDGYKSVLEYGKHSHVRDFQLFRKDKRAWDVTKLSDQCLVRFKYDWHAAVTDDENGDIVEAVLNRKPDNAIHLAEFLDEHGRSAMDISSGVCKQVLKNCVYFMKRYEFKTTRPEHKSKTSMIMLAVDGFTEEHVAIKFLRDRENFLMEMSCRADLDPKYIIPVLQAYDGDEDAEFLQDVKRKSFGEYRYAVVMPAADRNLLRILAQEHVAGKDWSQVAHMFRDIVQCTAHLHDQGIIHGDIKPLNIMRGVDGHIVLIDLDASVRTEEGFYMGLKYSSAYIPPEMINLASVSYRPGQQDSGHNTPRHRSPPRHRNHNLQQALHAMVKAIGPNEDLATLPFQPLRPDMSYDLWALGVVLFHMGSGEPLFLCNDSDNVDSRTLRTIHDWKDSFKTERLSRVDNPQARNLISRLLSKNPSARPNVSAILDHPFLSGKLATRLIGEYAEYDVFLSYRVSTDRAIVEQLYDLLTAVGLNVWLDNKCLKPGVPWEQGFMEGLIKSYTFVCVLSADGFVSAEDSRCNYMTLREDSACDSCLLEQQLALELRAMGMLEYIYPVFLGNASKDDPDVYSRFHFSAFSDLPNASVDSVAEKLSMHLDNQALGSPFVPRRTVKETISDLFANQGGFVEGPREGAVENIANSIAGMCFEEFEDVQKRPVSYRDLVDSLRDGLTVSRKSSMYGDGSLPALSRRGSRNMRERGDSIGSNRKDRASISGGSGTEARDSIGGISCRSFGSTRYRGSPRDPSTEPMTESGDISSSGDVESLKMENAALRKALHKLHNKDTDNRKRDRNRAEGTADTKCQCNIM
jgi:ankyrin repeat protein/serine/threonine protein kinase